MQCLPDAGKPLAFCPVYFQNLKYMYSFKLKMDLYIFKYGTTCECILKKWLVLKIIKVNNSAFWRKFSS
jgi:hypothetical protein